MEAITRHRPLASLPALGLCALLGLPECGSAQDDVGSDLARLDTENARLFIQPLARGLAWAMPSGVFDGGEPLGGLDFELGVRVSGALPPTAAETFHPVLPESIVWGGPFGGSFEDPYRVAEGGVQSPTVVGEGAGVVFVPDGAFRDAILASGEDPSDLALSLPRGREIPAVPYAVLHASLGLGLGTEVSLRFIPELEIDQEVGTLQGVGFAVRHAVTNWFTAPLDLSIVFASQQIDVGTYLEASSTAYGVMAGRRLGPLSLFAAGLVRSGTVDIAYEVENPGDANPVLPSDGVPIRFSEELETDAAFGVGARLQLLIMNLAGQYTFEDYPVLSLKVGFGTP